MEPKTSGIFYQTALVLTDFYVSEEENLDTQVVYQSLFLEIWI